MEKSFMFCKWMAAFGAVAGLLYMFAPGANADLDSKVRILGFIATIGIGAFIWAFDQIRELQHHVDGLINRIQELDEVISASAWGSIEEPQPRVNGLANRIQAMEGVVPPSGWDAMEIYIE